MHRLRCSGIFKVLIWLKNIVAAFRGMHVSPAKDSYAWLPLESVTTGQTHRRTDRRLTKWPLCAAMLRRRHNNISYSKSLKHAPWRNYKIYDVHNDVISDVAPLIIFCQMIPWLCLTSYFALSLSLPKVRVVFNTNRDPGALYRAQEYHCNLALFSFTWKVHRWM